MEEIMKALEQIIEDQVDQRTRELYRKWSYAKSASNQYAESLKLIIDEFNLEDKIHAKMNAAKKKYNDSVYADAMNGAWSPSGETNRAVGMLIYGSKQ